LNWNLRAPKAIGRHVDGMDRKFNRASLILVGSVVRVKRRFAAAMGCSARWSCQLRAGTREALYRTLSASGNRRLTSLSAILDATGLRLTIVPAKPVGGRAKTKTPARKRPRLSAVA